MLVWFSLGRAHRRNSVATLLFLLGMIVLLPQSARSTDSNNFVTAQASNTKSTLMSIQFRTPQNGWVVGTGGTILKTADGGKKWKRAVSGTSALLTCVYFADSLTGWVTGAGGFLSHTTNGGESWLSQHLDTQQALYGVYFTSPRIGWVVGGGGTIFHTVDGGQ
ncbi:MAG: YCF48-related protein, partial [Nitrospira sp.]